MYKNNEDVGKLVIAALEASDRLPNINDITEYLDSLWDFRHFNPRNETKGYGFTDLDGIIEVGGRYLIIEAKRNIHSQVRGQEIMFEKMVITGLFTIVKLVGDPKTKRIDQVRILYRSPDSYEFVYGEMQASPRNIRRIITAWIAWAKESKQTTTVGCRLTVDGVEEVKPFSPHEGGLKFVEEMKVFQ